MRQFRIIANPWFYRCGIILVVLDLLLFDPHWCGRVGFPKTWIYDVRGSWRTDRALVVRDGSSWQLFTGEESAVRTRLMNGDPDTFEIEYRETVYSRGWIAPAISEWRGRLEIRGADGSTPGSGDFAAIRDAFAERLTDAASASRSEYAQSRAARLATAPWYDERILWRGVTHDVVFFLVVFVTAMAVVAHATQMAVSNFRRARNKPGNCAGCQYDVTALPRRDGVALCPECGIWTVVETGAQQNDISEGTAPAARPSAS